MAGNKCADNVHNTWLFRARNIPYNLFELEIYKGDGKGYFEVILLDVQRDVGWGCSFFVYVGGYSLSGDRNPLKNLIIAALVFAKVS